MAFDDIDARRAPNVMRVAAKKLTVTRADGGTSVTEDSEINGMLQGYIVVAPNLTTDSDFIFSILNEDAKQIYAKASIADNATTDVLVSDKPVPLAGTMTFKMAYTTSQQPSFSLYLYYA